MSRYILIRLLWIVPSLIFISLIAFFISKAVPGDPVQPFLQSDRFGEEHLTIWENEKIYRRVAHQIGTDLPVFYFTLHSAVLPDTLHKIIPTDQPTLRKLTYQYGDWEEVQNYRLAIYELLETCGLENQQERQQYDESKAPIAYEAEYLLLASDADEINQRIDQLSLMVPDSFPNVSMALAQLEASFDKMISNKPGMNTYLPSFIWHGSENQYHRWFSGLLNGDFGLSNRDRKPVIEKIGSAMQWTLLINGLALFMAFAIAVPLGVYSARKKGAKMEKRLSSGLFVLFAIPSFWLATILVATLTTNEYSSWLNWFPTEGLGRYRDSGSLFQKWSTIAHHLVLPVFCLVVGSLAYITRQMRQSMVLELSSPYVLFYKSFGLSESKIVWRHAFRNALFPMITILGAAIPSLFSGSLIIEVIFNLPGMGRLMWQSIFGHDWNVVFAVLLFVSAITVISYLLTDILYQYFDPRIKMNHSAKTRARHEVG